MDPPTFRRAVVADHEIPLLANPDVPAPRPILDPAHFVTAVGEVVYEWDFDTDRLTWGANATSIFDPLGRAVPASGAMFATCIDPANGQGRFDAVFGSRDRDTGTGVSFSASYALRSLSSSPHGRLCWIEDRGRWFADTDGRPLRAQGIVRVQRMERLDAFRGFETERPNIPIVARKALLDRLQATASDPSALLLVAIKNAATLTTLYGRDVAESLAISLAELLRLHVRRTDTVLRCSGQTCALVLPGCSAAQAARVAQRLLKAAAGTPIPSAAGRLDLALVIGTAVSADGHPEAEALLRGAEDALDAGLESTSARIVAYAADADRTGTRKRTQQIARIISTALDENRLRLAYQPIVAAGTGAIFCHEALTRIAGESGEDLEADLVFRVAERGGLIQRIDRQTLALALAHLTDHPEQVLTVNVSPISFRDAEWISFADDRLADRAAAAPRLIIEITETAALGDVAITKALIERFRRTGARFAMDDFGAGNSSFRNLRQLGVEFVKIDGAFTRDLLRSPDDGVFVRALIDLARHLGIATVAEWVADEPTAALLTGWGIDYLQGHLFGKAEAQPRL